MIIPFTPKSTALRRDSRPRPGGLREGAGDPIPLVGHTDPWSWLLAASLKIDLWKLGRFNELVAQHGLPVHLGRMFRDPVYAYDRLSLAHGTGSVELKALSLEMFEQYLQLERRRRSPDAPERPFTPRH